MRKMTCEVYLSTPPVGYSGSPSTVNETNCNKKEVTYKKNMSSTNSSRTCPTMNLLRKSVISDIAVEILVLQFPHLTHDEDGF